LNKAKEASRPIRVFIIDSSARTRDGLRALFATWPEIELVGEATSSQEAMRLIEELHPAVVVMDLEMAWMSGVEVTQRIKQQWPTVTLIVITNSAAKRTAALAAGADDFIIKGDAPGRLLTALLAGNTANEI
jgi:DNA-binding NarL/FixJ family response regulator